MIRRIVPGIVDGQHPLRTLRYISERLSGMNYAEY
jgi:hypothetical protein